MPRPRLEASEVRHGTMAGFDWHIRWKNPSCEPCREAKRAAEADYRDRVRAREAKQARLDGAWRKACSRLAEKYPAEFREILAEEMRGLVELPPEEDEQGEAA